MSENRLSTVAQALLRAYNQPKKRAEALEGEEYKVSSTVSFFGFMYEKIRNAVEFHEEHLIRRIAIQRILSRRLAVNPSGKNEGENLIRELLWGRYVTEGTLTHADVKLFQRIISGYIFLFENIKRTHRLKSSENLGKIILELMSTEIEEAIQPELTNIRNAQLYFFYQTLKNKIDIEGVDDAIQDTYFYMASEKALAQNDSAFILYHLFSLKYGQVHKLSEKEIKKISEDFHIFVKESRAITFNPFDERLTKFAKKQVAPFRILYSLLDEKGSDVEELLTNEKKLLKEVSRICQEKYKQTGEKIKNAAIRSITYIFITKIIFVLILEVPLTQLVYGHIELLSIGVNALFPPFLMGLIVTFITPPSDKNTLRIYKRITDILTREPNQEQKTTLIEKKPKRNPVLMALFSVLYALTFSAIFAIVYLILDELGFNIISKGIFFFFISVVTFFSFRIRQIAKEYVLELQSSVLISFFTFLFMPFLYLGKIFSNTVSRINIFIIFFDYLIEAPFKFIIELVEEWVRFLKDRKDELV